MTVGELIEALTKLPQNAEVFEGGRYYGRMKDGMPVAELCDRAPVYYEAVFSCRSGLPDSGTPKKNVVLMEEP